MHKHIFSKLSKKKKKSKHFDQEYGFPDPFRSFCTLFQVEGKAHLKAFFFFLPNFVQTSAQHHETKGHTRLDFYTCMYTEKEEPAHTEIY